MRVLQYLILLDSASIFAAYVPVKLIKNPLHIDRDGPIERGLRDVLMPTESRYTKWPAGWLPSDCRDHIRLSNHSLASIDAFDVYYEDCPYPWVFCRHENATNTLDLMIELFGRLPVELRSYARNNIALPYIDKLSAESVNDDILLYRTTGLTTYAHEMGHIIDMHGYPANISGGQFSNSITWLAAYEKDVAVATGYSLTAQHENHSEMFVMALYDTNVPGGLQAIEPRYRDIRYQYLSIERYLRNTVLKPGGICTHRWENSPPVWAGKGRPTTMAPDVGFTRSGRVMVWSHGHSHAFKCSF